jgi:predicted nuclease of predicted toxin-antitoxin system
VRFLADEDFDNRIVRGLLRRLPGLDFVRVQDTPIAGAGDAAVLAWAATANRVLLTHDVNTMTAFASHRLREGLPLAGVLFVSQSLPISTAVEELLLIAEYSLEDEYRDQIRFIPFD